MRYSFLLFFLLLCFFGNADLLASEELLPFQEELLLDESAHSFGKQFVKMLGLLAAILCVMVGMAWMVRRVRKGPTFTRSQGELIRVMARYPLNQKTSLYLVEVAGKGVLIADAPGGVSTLLEVDLSETTETTSSFSEKRENFTNILQRVISRKPLLKE